MPADLGLSCTQRVSGVIPQEWTHDIDEFSTSGLALLSSRNENGV